MDTRARNEDDNDKMQMSAYWIFFATALFLQSSSGHLFGQFYRLGKEKGRITDVAFFEKSDWIRYRSDNQLKPEDLSSITDVRLNDHEISIEELKHVCSLPSLVYLAIGYGPEGVEVNGDLRELPQMTSLETLQICKKEIEDEDLNFLSKCPNLKHLMVQPYGLAGAGESGVLTDDLAKRLLTLRHLETLEFHHKWSFTDKFIESISRLENLRELRIYSDQISGSSLRIIAEKTGIKRLMIGSDGLVRRDIAVLLSTERLDELEVNFRDGELTLQRAKDAGK